MIHQRSVILASVLIAASASAGVAQDRGQFGLTMGYPGSIGVVWHITDAVAVRPDFDFHAASESGRSGTSSTTFGVGISGLWYFARHEALRMYVAPRYVYGRNTTELQISVPQNVGINIGTLPSINTTVTTHSLFGSFGAQYAVHKRFGIFGEVGLGYSQANRPSPAIGFSDVLGTFSGIGVTEVHSWATRSAAGVILYFRD